VVFIGKGQVAIPVPFIFKQLNLKYMLQTQLKELKNNKICKLIDSSSFYPDRGNVKKLTPDPVSYLKAQNALKRTSVKRLFNGKFTYKFEPSEDYKKLKELRKKCEFHLNKRFILHSPLFLDKILPLIWNCQRED